MKTLIVAILMFICSTSSVLATAQAPDKIIYDGKEYDLHTNPMESYFAKHPDKRPKGEVISTNLWRGYVATFEFKTNDFVLKDIEMMIWDKTKDEPYDTSWKSVKADIIPKGEELLVSWFTGILVLPYGELVNYVHMGYGSTYSNYILLSVKEGKLIGKRTFDCKQYEEFKERQFQAYKKTKDYKTQIEGFRNDMSQDNIDRFLRSYIVNYTSEFLDKEEMKNESSSKAIDNNRK